MTLKDIGAKLNALPGEIAAALGKLNTTSTASTFSEKLILEVENDIAELSAKVGKLQTDLTACETANATLTDANTKLTADLAEANKKLSDPKGEAAAKAAEILASSGLPAAIAATATVQVEAKTGAQLRAEHAALVSAGKSSEAGQFYNKNFK